MSTVLLVMTDGRLDCLAATLESFDQMVHGDICQRIIHDDSANDDYRAWLKRTYGDRYLILGDPTQRRGFGGAIAASWRWLTDNSPSDTRFVFHLEDDFTFNRPIVLGELADVLTLHDHVAQVALRRQPWNAAEAAAGGIVEQHPDEYQDCSDALGHQWLEHRMFWTTNPALYRIGMCRRTWPTEPHSEGLFSLNLFQDPDVVCAYWGARDSGEWVTHIGDVRAGAGY